MLKNEKKVHEFFFFYHNMMYIKIFFIFYFSPSYDQFIININCSYEINGGAIVYNTLC